METINNRGAVRLFVCGDIVNLSDKSSIIGPLLSHIIKKADFAVGNLEGVELTARQVKSKQPSQFTGTIAHLAEVGFDMMLLANNHITDFGHDQLLNTINLLKKNNLYYLGAGFSWEETYQPVIVQIKSLKFGFLNVCEAQVGQMTNHNQDFGYAWMSYDQLFDDVKHLSKEVDKVVVFVHAGLEHYTLPLPEIRSFYKRISDAGADAVIGGHPHIVQGFEYYKNSFIAYSLGNFYFPHPAGVYEEENKAFSLMLEFTEEGKIHPKVIYHSLSNGVVEIENNKADQINVFKLCEQLENGYESKADEMCLSAYNQIRYLLIQSLCGENENIGFVERIKDLIRRTLFRKKYIINTKTYRDKLLLRLFENESYRFTIIRALKQICK